MNDNDYDDVHGMDGAMEMLGYALICAIAVVGTLILWWVFA